MSKKMLGQAELMEYIFMTFLIMVVLVVVILFLAGWQASQMRLEKAKTESQHILNTLKLVSTSPIFVKEPSIYDTGKLLALQGQCAELEKIFGKGWSLVISVIGKDPVNCTEQNWPSCSQWIICQRQGNYTGYVFPAGIYWPAGQVTTYGIHPIIELGTIEVRWYG
ncbi:MAG: hypothetical protein QXP39_02570 [Candidatus Aenigmatarchaeota archaeon]